MEDLKQLLERMFHTRKLKGYTHHEGHQGVITIRFSPGLGSHVNLESDQNNTQEYHATFKPKRKSQMDRDKNRSYGFIRHYNTRSRNTQPELPRYSDHFQNIFVSNLSPDASIFTPSIIPQPDHNPSASPSPVINFQHNNSICDDALLSDPSLSDSHQDTVFNGTCNEEPSPVLRENSPERITLPVLPDTVREHTDDQPDSQKNQADTNSSDEIRSSPSLKDKDSCIAGPVEFKKPRKKVPSIEIKTVKCHLCKIEFDFLSQGCCYYDEYRLKDNLHFCSVTCMDCDRDSELPVI